MKRPITINQRLIAIGTRGPVKQVGVENNYSSTLTDKEREELEAPGGVARQLIGELKNEVDHQKNLALYVPLLVYGKTGSPGGGFEPFFSIRGRNKIKKNDAGKNSFECQRYIGFFFGRRKSKRLLCCYYLANREPVSLFTPSSH